MQLRGTMRINERGHLEIGGCDAVELARRFGTPLYVFDEDAIRSRCRAYTRALADHYPDNEVFYAGKAFLTTGTCRLMEQEGLGIDVVSGGELYTAMAADFPPGRLIFHGNNKSREELNMALEAGVGRIVVDNGAELLTLAELAARRGVKPAILFRVTPGVSAHTHSYIRTGQLDSKFGIPIAHGQARAAVRQALALESVRLVGFHCHIGSQIFDLESFGVAVGLMADFVRQVRDETGFVTRELDMGGGLGIRYTAKDTPQSPQAYVSFLAKAVRAAFTERGLPLPRLLTEPGRSIVGEAGTTLYTVGTIKSVPGVRTYVAVDGGMADNPRVALYQAVYEAVVANKAAAPASQVVSIAGKCCESGDMLIWDLAVPPVQPGDILAVFATGAYNHSMASNYNRLPRPAAVLVSQGRASLLVRRESLADLVRQDVIPEHMAAAAAARRTASG